MFEIVWNISWYFGSVSVVPENISNFGELDWVSLNIMKYLNNSYMVCNYDTSSLPSNAP